MKKFLVLAITLSISLLSLFKPYTAKANSAQTDWSGSSQTGAIVTGEECPLTVQKEILTFDIQNFPSHDDMQYNNENYTASVSANYYFYNPTDLDLTIELAFPFGNLPYYISHHYINYDKYRHNYNVEINGEKITIHTFKGDSYIVHGILR